MFPAFSFSSLFLLSRGAKTVTILGFNLGLDQYWFVKTKHAKKEDKLFFQHRKIPALEKFMADKWKSNSEFNCQRLYINLEILNELRTKCRDKTLDEGAS